MPLRDLVLTEMRAQDGVVSVYTLTGLLSIQNRANATAARRKNDWFNLQVGLVVKASDALSFYAVYGSGFRSNVAITIALNTVALETSKSYELGAKFNLLAKKLNGKLPGDLDLLFSYADAEAKADVLDLNFSLKIRSGDPLVNILKHSLNVQLSKGFVIGDGMGLTIGTGL